MIVFYIAVLMAGFLVLVKGADIFVDASSSLARIFSIPPVIIGLTIVACGTSLPELAVSTTAALDGANEIALSNVVGSNIFNLLFILGVCAAIRALPVEKTFLKRDYPVSLITTVLVLAITAVSTIKGGKILSLAMEAEAGLVSRISGIFLVLIFVFYIIWIIAEARRNPPKDEKAANAPLWKVFLLTLIGLILIIVGGKAVVCGAQYTARFFGLSETLIGLTVVAVGTSLPELATSLIAAHKGKSELAVGNIIGSNIFNLLFILGISAVLHPVTVNAASVYDMAILAAGTALTWIFSVTGRKIGRAEGIIMIALYCASTIFAALR